MINSKHILTFILLSLIVLQNTPPNLEQEEKKLKSEKLKIEEGIKKTEQDIKKLTKELKVIKKRILESEQNLNKATKEAIKGQEDLIETQASIDSYKSEILTLNNQISNLDKTIKRQSKEIKTQESKIDSIGNIVFHIKSELENIPKKIYESDTDKNISWEDKQYLESLIDVDKYNYSKHKQYNEQKITLYKYKVKLEQDLKKIELSKIYKKRLLENSKKILSSLEKQYEVRNEKLLELKRKREKVKSQVTQTKKEKDKTIEKIEKIENLASKLLQDKKKNKKRTEELAKIRRERKKTVSENFSKMKGKLSWPNNGSIVVKFGNQINPELNTITENTGIEIKCSGDLNVKSVMDGIVMGIRYIPTYGNIIIIDHGDEYSTVYANLDSIFINEDEYVASDTIIGTVSNSGNKRGLLHFEIWKKDKKLNPESWLIKK